MTDEIIIKFLLGESSESENIEMKNWLSASADNQKYFDDMKLIWDTSKRLETQNHEDVDAAWLRFKERAETMKIYNYNQNKYTWIKIAASVILVCTITWFTYQYFKTPEMLAKTTSSNVDSILLPDGSEVKLNQFSSISYPEEFKGDKRMIKLTKGEAFFTVTPNKERPFIIQTKDVTVRVVGTSFNVKCTDAETEVIVETGNVKVTKKTNEVSLHPGEKVIAKSHNQDLEKEKVKDDFYNYYFTKTLVANGTPLWRLVETLNQVYHVEIVIQDVQLKNKELTSTFKDESLDNILDVLKETFHLQIIKKENQIILKQ